MIFRCKGFEISYGQMSQILWINPRRYIGTKFEVRTLMITYIIFMPVLTLLHELGHAIPALIFTKEKVIINMGILI